MAFSPARDPDQPEHVGHFPPQDLLAYVLRAPDAIEGEEPEAWPLVVFLHGSGERGSDLERLRRHGPLALVDQGRELPFYALVPQCPTDSDWRPLLSLIWEEIDRLLATEAIDPERIYLTGLSLGGYGTWALAAYAPDRVAALAPICGGGDPRLAEKLSAIPAWFVHGALDRAVGIEESAALVRALREAGGSPRFTVYPYGGHNVWTRTYEDEAFWDWLLAQRRGVADPLAEAWTRDQERLFAKP
jgi:predicted peptidase